MRAHAAAFLRDVEVSSDSPQACVAHRAAGITHWFAGEYAEAREHLERALALFKPGRDDDLAFRFGHDAGVAAALYLALTLWPLGEVGYAASLLRSAQVRIATLAYIGTRAYGTVQATLFELMLGDRSRAASNAASSRVSRANMICLSGERSGSFSTAWRVPKAARPAAAWRTCAAGSNFCVKRAPYCSMDC